MGRAILVTASMVVLTLGIRPPVRQLIGQLEGNHSYQKGDEKQRRYQDEQSLSAEHKKLLL
jgi:hypothetical protein